MGLLQGPAPTAPQKKAAGKQAKARDWESAHTERAGREHVDPLLCLQHAVEGAAAAAASVSAGEKRAFFCQLNEFTRL